ncbi:unnamed protein product [Linum trigynum]|uniref:Uncharacterized protein n=1 Tax=Linum trigynum TaxID=586398 RepID=A0AAV2GWS7_9ROSI
MNRYPRNLPQLSLEKSNCGAKRAVSATQSSKGVIFELVVLIQQHRKCSALLQHRSQPVARCPISLPIPMVLARGLRRLLVPKQTGWLLLDVPRSPTDRPSSC